LTLEILLALAVVMVAFFISCKVCLDARSRFLFFCEFEIAKRTARNVSMRLHAKQAVPSVMNGFEVSVREERIELRRGKRVYSFDASDF